MIRMLPFAAFLLAAAPAAAAQDEGPAAEPIVTPGAFEISAEAILLSDYRFRGVSRSDEDPAVQAGLMVTHESGLYGGLRGTTLRGRDGFRLRDPGFRDFGEAQVDLFAGYGTSLGGGFEADGGIMAYAFAGGQGDTFHVEPYASLSYLIGPLQLSAGAKYAPPQAAIGDEAILYLYGQAEIAIPFRPWAFTAQMGRQDWGAYGSYWTWSLGARHRLRIAGLPRTEIALSYVDTDLPPIAGQDGGLVLSVNVGF